VSAPDRAARVAALRTVLDIAERYPEIPEPAIGTSPGGANVWWFLTQDAPRQMALLEEALAAAGCELAGGARKAKRGDCYLYELEGVLGGYTVAVLTPAENVAESKVATTVTEAVEWVRKPAAPESGDGE
jgi:hypothetical protein